MKKFLPLSEPNESKGFTLVELMVAIAIISILSVIGYGIFSGAQGGARDARRRVEIDQLAKNIETTRDPATGYYQYTTANGVTDYPNGLPEPGSYIYCYNISTTSSPPNPPSNWQSATCPGFLSIGGNPFTVTNNPTGADLTDLNTVKGWILCASAERTVGPICKTNILR